MKIKVNQPLSECVGRIKTEDKFLLWPRRYDGFIWWLQRARITYKVVECSGGLLEGPSYMWTPIRIEDIPPLQGHP